jgi:hypothetical protein
MSGQLSCVAKKRLAKVVSISLIVVELAAVGVSLLEVVRYQAR